MTESGPPPPKADLDGAEPTRLGTDVFISYAREDRPFVGRLHDALQGSGRAAWVDWEGIAASARWMAEVRAAIDAADAFCFVISPDSVESPVCREEASHAAGAGKRIVPVLARRVADDLVPEAVAAHNWIDFTDQAGFDEAFDILARAISTDPEHVREHTRLLVRAKEWEAAGRDKALLLRGAELDKAETWLGASSNAEPAPTALQASFVIASRRSSRRRRRSVAIVVASILAAAAILGGVAFTQRQQAARAEASAEANSRSARAREVAAAASAAVPTDPELSLLLALEGIELEQNPETERALVEAVGEANLRWIGSLDSWDWEEGIGPIRGPREIPTFESVAFDDSGSLLSGGGDGSVVRWGGDGSVETLVDDLSGWVTGIEPLEDGSIVVVGLAGSIDFFGFGGTGFANLYSPGGELVDTRLSESDDVYAVDAPLGGGSVFLGTEEGNVISYGVAPDGFTELWTTRVDDGSSVFGVAVASDGSVIVATTGSGEVVGLDARTGRILDSTSGHTGAASDVAALPDGSGFVTVGNDGLLRWWELDAEDGTFTPSSMPPLSHPERIRAVAVSADGALIATADNAGLARVWDANSGALVAELVGHDAWLTDVAFAPVEPTVATASGDGTVRSWSSGTRAPTAIGDPGGSISAMSSSSDEVYAVVSRELQVIDQGGSVVAPDEPAPTDDRVWEVASSPDGHLLVAAGGSKGWLWSGGNWTEVDFGQLNSVNGASFSENRRLLVYGAHAPGAFIGEPEVDSEAVVLDSESGDILQRIGGVGEGYSGGAISPNGELIALVMPGGFTVRTFGGSTVLSSNLSQEFSVQEYGAAAFSPDGETLLVTSDTDDVLIFRTAPLDPNAPEPAPLAQISTGHGSVTTIRVSPDGLWVATSGTDGRVRVWSTEQNWTLVATFSAGSVPSRGESTKFVGSAGSTPAMVAFTVDHRLTASTASGPIRIFDCVVCRPLPELVEYARSLTTRELTDEERAAYLS